jgi:phage terminase large subunit GpA-like protein
MSFFKKLTSMFSAPTRSDTDSYWIYVRCNRCGETIRARVNLYNDLSPNYEEGETTYFCRKVLIGESHCFQRIEVSLTFDQNRKVIDQQATGGKFITEAEYSQGQAAST